MEIKYITSDRLSAKLIRALLGSAGLRILSMAFSFFVGVILARKLGASGYGTYAFVMSTIALLTVPTEFGLPSLVVREVAAAHTKKAWGRIKGVLQWSNVFVGVVSSCFLGATILWLLGKETSDNELFLQTLFWGVLLIPLVALSNLRGAALRSLEHVVRGQLPELMFRPGIFLLLLISMVWVTNIPLNAHYAMMLHVIATAIAFLIGTVMLFKAMPPQCHDVKPIIESKKWIASAFPMALSEGMRFLQGHISILLLGLLATQAEIGLFRIAVQVGLLVGIPVSLVNVVVAPYISRFYAEKNFLQLKKMMTYAALGMFLSVLLLLLFFTLFGEYFLAVFFGAEFKEAYYTLIIICSGQLINAFFGLSVMLLTMSHHEHAVMRAFLVSLVLSSFFAWGIIPLYGILGAAIASIVGIFVWNIMLWKYTLRILDINTSILSIINHNNTSHEKT